MIELPGRADSLINSERGVDPNPDILQDFDREEATITTAMTFDGEGDPIGLLKQVFVSFAIGEYLKNQGTDVTVKLIVADSFVKLNQGRKDPPRLQGVEVDYHAQDRINTLRSLTELYSGSLNADDDVVIHRTEALANTDIHRELIERISAVSNNDRTVREWLWEAVPEERKPSEVKSPTEYKERRQEILGNLAKTILDNLDEIIGGGDIQPIKKRARELAVNQYDEQKIVEYAVKEVAIIFQYNTDIKVGPPREYLYDRLAQHETIRKAVDGIEGITIPPELIGVYVTDTWPVIIGEEQSEAFADRQWKLPPYKNTSTDAVSDESDRLLLGDDEDTIETKLDQAPSQLREDVLNIVSFMEERYVQTREEDLTGKLASHLRAIRETRRQIPGYSIEHDPRQQLQLRRGMGELFGFKPVFRDKTAHVGTVVDVNFTTKERTRSPNKPPIPSKSVEVDLVGDDTVVLKFENFELMSEKELLEAHKDIFGVRTESINVCFLKDVKPDAIEDVILTSSDKIINVELQQEYDELDFLPDEATFSIHTNDENCRYEPIRWTIYTFNVTILDDDEADVERTLEAAAESVESIGGRRDPRDIGLYEKQDDESRTLRELSEIEHDVLKAINTQTPTVDSINPSGMDPEDKRIPGIVGELQQRGLIERHQELTEEGERYLAQGLPETRFYECARELGADTSPVAVGDVFDQANISPRERQFAITNFLEKYGKKENGDIVIEQDATPPSERGESDVLKAIQDGSFSVNDDRKSAVKELKNRDLVVDRLHITERGTELLE